MDSVGLEREVLVSERDFAEIFGEPPSDFLKAKIREYGFRFERLTAEEREDCLAKARAVLSEEGLQTAGEHRREQWQAGWAENLEALQKQTDLGAIVPRYFEKHHIVRFKQEWVRPKSPDFEYRMLAIIQNWLFDKYLRDADEIYEFGCGTGHNLFRVREVNSRAKIWGLDWAESSQAILQKLNSEGIDKNIFGHRFDYFAPDYKFELAKNSVVVTVASLEQIGTKFELFLEYLLSKKPRLCIHIEPIAELLDPSNLLDELSIAYFKKRNYLSGFLVKLRELENSKKLKIQKAQRTFIGSFFIEGYSVIVWSPDS